MRIVFLSAMGRMPSGGHRGIFEFCNGLTRRGHETHVVHIDFMGQQPIRRIEEIDWFEFDPRIHHHFPGVFDAAGLPDADIVFCFDDRIPEGRALPVIWMQAHGAFPRDVEARMWAAPYPKICTSTYLVDVALRKGVPAHRAIHVPYGLRHDQYRVVTPTASRPMRVAMRYEPVGVKGPVEGLEAMEIAREHVPELQACCFGTTGRYGKFPEWVEYVHSPPQPVLIDEIYNGSRAFVMSSQVEGFGMVSIEAMACGCALVATDSGGPRDYAINGETALVSPPKDPDALAANLVEVLTDDDLRLRLVNRALAFVQRFDWDSSAALLEGALEQYVTDRRVT